MPERSEGGVGLVVNQLIILQACTFEADRDLNLHATPNFVSPEYREVMC